MSRKRSPCAFNIPAPVSSSVLATSIFSSISFLINWLAALKATSLIAFFISFWASRFWRSISSFAFFLIRKASSFASFIICCFSWSACALAETRMVWASCDTLRNFSSYCSLTSSACFLIATEESIFSWIKSCRFWIKVSNLSQKNFLANITIKNVEIQTKTTSVNEIRK